MHIVILRHGQAEAYASSDEQRNLTDRGVRDAEQAGKCMAELNLEFDCAWVSPYLRAQQTAEQVLKSLPDLEVATESLLTPEASPAAVFELIKQSGLDRLLIVSHQPLVGELTALLADEKTAYACPLSPASMVAVENAHLLPGCGDLGWLRHPPEFHRER